MKCRLTLAAAIVVFAAPYLEAQPAMRARPMGDVSSFTQAPIRAVERGAVYEVKLRVKGDNVEQYLVDYARWFLPVDQFACSGAGCESSGRKLLTVLTREHGDRFNLVFLWRYEDAWKDGYYCKYSKAFFQHHAASATTKDEFTVLYDAVKDRRKLSATLAGTLGSFPKNCLANYTESEVAALELARDTIQEVEKKLIALIEEDEASWNFDINVCKVAALRDNPAVTRKALEEGEDGKPALCPRLKRSLLERAVDEIKWETAGQTN